MREEKAKEAAGRRAVREAEMAAKRAAREVEMATKRAAREAEMAAKRQAREEAAEQAKGTARAAREEEAKHKAAERAEAQALTARESKKQPKASSMEKQIEAAAARAAAQAVQQAMAAMGMKKAIPKPRRAKPSRPAVPSVGTAPPPPPPPSSRGRAIKRKAIYGDAGELDGAASSYRSAPVASKPAVNVAEINSVPEFAMPTNRVWARGWHAGVHKWFKARVVKLRRSVPRIHIAFEADEHGNSHKHALPELDAYVHGADVRPADW